MTAVRDLTDLDRLRVAGYAAPRLRSSKPRRITTVDAAGNLVREITSTELQTKLLERVGIEFDVEPGTKPTKAICKGCGLPFTLPKRGGDLGGGRMPERCRKCRDGNGQSECAGFGGPCPDRRKATARAHLPYMVAMRNGEPWRCHACGARRGRAAMSAEQLSAAALKGKATMGPERIAETIRKAHSHRRRKEPST